MPVTDAHLDKPMPWTEHGKTGMPIKPTGRPCGTLANLAGIAENVGGLTEEERLLRDRPDPLLVMSSTPAHVAVTDDSHSEASSPSNLAFRSMDRAIAAAVDCARRVRRATPRRHR